MITIEVDDRRVLDVLHELGTSVNDLTPVMRDILVRPKARSAR